MQSRLLKNIPTSCQWLGDFCCLRGFFFQSNCNGGFLGAIPGTKLSICLFGFFGATQNFLVLGCLFHYCTYIYFNERQVQKEGSLFATPLPPSPSFLGGSQFPSYCFFSPGFLKIAGPSYSQELSSQLGGLYSPIFPDPHSIGLDGGFSCTSQLQQTLYPRSTGGDCTKA